jgi:hypothetical protein
VHKRFLGSLFLTALVLTAIFAGQFLALTPVSAQSLQAPVFQSEVLCGSGSEADDYGFTYDLSQYHWTMDWEDYADEDIVDQVDVVFDALNADNIAQTMILFKPAEDVGIRVNCAVHFLRYMQLGQPDGKRRDNGFVILIVVEEDEIDVHYGVGLGLPALTAHDLTDLNRLAEDTYDSTGSMNAVLLALANGFDEYARSKYEPYMYPTSVTKPSAPVVGAASSAVAICLVCSLLLIFIIFIIIILRSGRRKRRRSPLPSHYRPRRTVRPSSRPPSPVRPPRPSSTWSTPRPRPRPSSSPRPAPRRPTRRGSGGGRSGRGN